MSEHLHLPPKMGRAAGYVGEFAFVLGALLASMFAALVVLGQINPLESPVITITWIAVTLIAFGHHLWYERHKAEILTSWQHQHDRERRGF